MNSYPVCSNPRTIVLNGRGSTDIPCCSLDCPECVEAAAIRAKKVAEIRLERGRRSGLSRVV